MLLEQARARVTPVTGFQWFNTQRAGRPLEQARARVTSVTGYQWFNTQWTGRVCFERNARFGKGRTLLEQEYQVKYATGMYLYWSEICIYKK